MPAVNVFKVYVSLPQEVEMFFKGLKNSNPDIYRSVIEQRYSCNRTPMEFSYNSKVRRVAIYLPNEYRQNLINESNKFLFFSLSAYLSYIFMNYYLNYFGYGRK